MTLCLVALAINDKTNLVFQDLFGVTESVHSPLQSAVCCLGVHQPGLNVAVPPLFALPSRFEPLVLFTQKDQFLFGVNNSLSEAFHYKLEEKRQINKR